MTSIPAMGAAGPGAQAPGLTGTVGLGADADMSAATTYTDVNALAALKRDPNSPQAISAVAQQVEALFLQMMLKSMRDATAGDSPDSNEMSMYQDMFDKQVALTMSKHADLGIAKLLRRQTSPGGQAGTPGGNIQPLKVPEAAAAGIALTPKDFVNRMLPSITKAASALGVHPAGLMAQAALETGWGQHTPRNADGSSSFNLFGVKAGDEWSGARATVDTMEVSNGIATPKRASFRAYGSIEDSVNDFANLLKNSARYKEAVAAGGSAQSYVQSIGKSGYATDPEYADKLNQILSSGTIQAALAAAKTDL